MWRAVLISVSVNERTIARLLASVLKERVDCKLLVKFDGCPLGGWCVRDTSGC